MCHHSDNFSTLTCFMYAGCIGHGKYDWQIKLQLHLKGVYIYNLVPDCIIFITPIHCEGDADPLCVCVYIYLCVTSLWIFSYSGTLIKVNECVIVKLLHIYTFIMCCQFHIWIWNNKWLMHVTILSKTILEATLRQCKEC